MCFNINELKTNWIVLWAIGERTKYILSLRASQQQNFAYKQQITSKNMCAHADNLN
jgi:hypothetical protein